MGWIATFRERLEMRMRKLKEMTAADWQAVLANTEQDMREAELALARKKETFEAAYFELTAINDQTGVARHRKGIRDATEHLAELREAHTRAQRALEEATACEQQADLEARWRKAEEIGGQFHEQAAVLQRSADAFVRELDVFLDLGQELRNALPERPGVSEEASLMYVPYTAVRRIQIYLFGKSNGRFSTGGLTQGVHEIVQGPNLTRRAQETLALAFRRRPKSDPPEAA